MTRLKIKKPTHMSDPIYQGEFGSEHGESVRMLVKTIKFSISKSLRVQICILAGILSLFRLPELATNV